MLLPMLSYIVDAVLGAFKGCSRHFDCGECQKLNPPGSGLVLNVQGCL